eukprot:TRINITY_DN4118_c0_g1_i1.p1 TRINITY_DN4118_c0_g1~~TRINITY_DN4118_c0_g1_i1.p1  ORF type:complete len:674 (+),score=130.32 TRINITY_DN4118_c0_g1_i1:175-2022(+)
MCAGDGALWVSGGMLPSAEGRTGSLGGGVPKRVDWPLSTVGRQGWQIAHKLLAGDAWRCAPVDGGTEWEWTRLCAQGAPARCLHAAALQPAASGQPARLLLHGGLGVRCDPGGYTSREDYAYFGGRELHTLAVDTGEISEVLCTGDVPPVICSHAAAVLAGDWRGGSATLFITGGYTTRWHRSLATACGMEHTSNPMLPEKHVSGAWSLCLGSYFWRRLDVDGGPAKLPTHITALTADPEGGVNGAVCYGGCRRHRSDREARRQQQPGRAKARERPPHWAMVPHDGCLMEGLLDDTLRMVRFLPDRRPTGKVKGKKYRDADRNKGEQPCILHVSRNDDSDAASGAPPGLGWLVPLAAGRRTAAGGAAPGDAHRCYYLVLRPAAACSEPDMPVCELWLRTLGGQWERLGPEGPPEAAAEAAAPKWPLHACATRGSGVAVLCCHPLCGDRGARSLHVHLGASSGAAAAPPAAASPQAAPAEAAAGGKRARGGGAPRAKRARAQSHTKPPALGLAPLEPDPAGEEEDAGALQLMEDFLAEAAAAGAGAEGDEAQGAAAAADAAEPEADAGGEVAGMEEFLAASGVLPDPAPGGPAPSGAEAAAAASPPPAARDGGEPR